MSSLKQYLTKKKDEPDKMIIRHKEAGVLIYADAKTILESNAKYLSLNVESENMDSENKVNEVTIA